MSPPAVIGVTAATILPLNMDFSARFTSGRNGIRAGAHIDCGRLSSVHAADLMKQLLAISAIGTDRTGMVHDLTRTIADCGGSLSESRMIALGAEFAALMLVSGNWHALARLETELKKLAETNAMILELKRTEERAPRTTLLPYSVDVVCID